MIKFNGKELRIDGTVLILPYSILDAEESSEKIFIVYDYMEFPMNGPAPNLVCIEKSGKELWVADNPTSQSNDAFTNFSRTNKSTDNCISVNNFAGYLCQVNKSTGELNDVQFTK